MTIYVLKRGQDLMLLCVDFAGKKIKIIGVEREEKKFKVVTALEFDGSDLALSFGEYLKSTSVDVDEIRVSGALENTFHKIFILPDLKKKMLKSALETEVIKTFGNDYQFRYQDLGEVPGPGNKVNRKVMAVGIKRNNLEELSQMFADSRTKPNIYTTYPAALQALLEKMGILSEEPLAFMELDHPTGRIIVFKGKEIRLTRELPLAEGEKDPESSALTKDIYRTLLFYNDTYPEERVSRLMFTGNSTTSETMQNLSQKTGAEIIPFDPETVFQGMKEIPHIHPGCLGLALLNPDRCSFGFMPFSVQEKRKIKKTLTLSTCAFFGVLLILALGISRFSLDLRNLSAFHGGIKGEIKMKEDRLKEMPLEFVSQSIETSQPPWSEILLELAAVVPPGVALETFTLKKVKRAWRGEVTGVADGTDEINSLLLVEEVQNNFVQSPLFGGVKLTERELQGKQVAFKIIYQLDI
ncbi:MAG: PilN domain-containing protein [candidate division Zixibacteria bacterium]|nr:PilN domain-containing protein [candidate division Zixibacteria bacterium]